MPSIIPSIPITLDRPRFLRLTNWARCRAERELCTYWQRDLSLYDALTHTPMRANDFCILVWAALLEDDPNLTVREAMNLMDLVPQPVLMEALIQAWNIATPADEHPAPPVENGAPFGSEHTVSIGQPSGATAAPSWD